MTFDLKTSLDDLAAAEYAGAPVSTVDIGKARADGRRRVLAARLAPVGGGLAVAAACALVVNALGGTSPAADRAPEAAAKHTFTGTDPLTSVGTFGWLPDGFQVASHTTGSFYGTGVTAHTKPVPSGDAGFSMPVSLTLTTSPTEPQLPSYETKKAVSVKGSPKAYIVTNPGDGPTVPADLSLRWQTASGSWFILGGDYKIHGTELESLLIKVAESVTADDSPVPMPIHIEGLPKDATLGEVSLDDPVVVGQGGIKVGMVYTDGTNPATHGSFSISAATIGLEESSTVTINGAKPAGTPVTGDPNAGGPAGHGTAVCKDSNGLRICVTDQAMRGDDALASVGGAQGLLDRITSLGTDPANWTTNVVN